MVSLSKNCNGIYLAINIELIYLEKSPKLGKTMDKTEAMILEITYFMTNQTMITY